MRVLLVGDVHGQYVRLADVLARYQDTLGVDAAIQVGDYGFSERAMADHRNRYPIPVHVIDGNHEDHPWLHRALASGTDAAWRDRLALFYQPRPSIASIGHSDVGFLGGALHVDRPQRHDGADGLPNYIRRREADAASVLFNEQRPSLIVSHSCPSRIGIGLTCPEALRTSVLDHVVAAGFDPGRMEDCGEAELTRLWHALTYRPQAWVFGHHHRPHATTIEGTQFVCVGDIDTALACPVVWDADALTLSIGAPTAYGA